MAASEIVKNSNSRKIPGYWEDAPSDFLRQAIEAYLVDAEMTTEEVGAMRVYLRQWIEADGWVAGAYLDKLRASVGALRSPTDIAHWLAEAIELGINPL